MDCSCTLRRLLLKVNQQFLAPLSLTAASHDYQFPEQAFLKFALLKFMVIILIDAFLPFLRFFSSIISCSLQQRLPLAITSPQADPAEHLSVSPSSTLVTKLSVEVSWLVWWVDLGWMPDAHQAALSFPSSAGQEGEKIDEKKTRGLR